MDHGRLFDVPATVELRVRPTPIVHGSDVVRQGRASEIRAVALLLVEREDV